MRCIGQGRCEKIPRNPSEEIANREVVVMVCSTWNPLGGEKLPKPDDAMLGNYYKVKLKHLEGWQCTSCAEARLPEL